MAFTVLQGNPMYLGSLTPYLVIPVFFLIIQKCFIKHEEPFLENIFVEEYLDYKGWSEVGFNTKNPQ